MSKEALEALLGRLDVWLLVFGAVVAIGVAGESFFGIRHWWNSRLLRQILDAEAKAKDQEITGLRLQVEESRRANLEMQERIQPRDIAPKRIDAFVGELKAKSGQHFAITAGASDAEGAVFAIRLYTLLLRAAWVPEETGIKYGAFLDLAVGVRIVPGTPPNAVEAGRVLHQALGRAGIATSLLPEAGPDNAVRITVGVKPLPELTIEEKATGAAKSVGSATGTVK